MFQSDSPYLKKLLLKERISSLWERILAFKRSSHFGKGRNCRESLLDTVVSLRCALLFQRSGDAIEFCQNDFSFEHWPH